MVLSPLHRHSPRRTRLGRCAPPAQSFASNHKSPYRRHCQCRGSGRSFREPGHQLTARECTAQTSFPCSYGGSSNGAGGTDCYETVPGPRGRRQSREERTRSFLNLAGRSWVSVGMWRSPMTRTRTMAGEAGWMEEGSRLRLSCARHGCVIACLNSGIWVATEAGGGLARLPPPKALRMQRGSETMQCILMCLLCYLVLI